MTISYYNLDDVGNLQKLAPSPVGLNSHLALKSGVDPVGPGGAAGLGAASLGAAPC